MGRPLVRRRAVRRRRLWVLAAVALCLVGYLYYRPVKSYVRVQNAVEQRRQDVRRLVAEKRELERRLALDASGITLVREARRLGLVRPGERLFIVKGIAQWRKSHAVKQHG